MMSLATPKPNPTRQLASGGYLCFWVGMVVVRKPRPAKVRAMLLEIIRELNAAAPFEPYFSRMVSGRQVVVSHPDCVMIAPKGSWVIVADEDEHPHHLSTLMIEEVRPLRVRRRAKRS